MTPNIGDIVTHPDVAVQFCVLSAPRTHRSTQRAFVVPIGTRESVWTVATSFGHADVARCLSLLVHDLAATGESVTPAELSAIKRTARRFTGL